MMWSVASYARLDLRPIPLEEFMQFVLRPRPETLHGTPKAKLLFSKVHPGEGQCCLPLVAVNLQGQNSASRHFEAGIGVWVHEEVMTWRQNRCDSCHRQALGGGGGGGGTQIANNMLCERFTPMCFNRFEHALHFKSGATCSILATQGGTSEYDLPSPQI